MKNRQKTSRDKYDVNDISKIAQRHRLLAALRERPVTTLNARSELNIMSPAPRIFELRRHGYHIVTYWKKDVTPAGLPHKVAEYFLLSDGKEGGNANG